MSLLNRPRAFIYCLCAGITFMILALQLHPMKTENFLAQAFSAPMTTFSRDDGLHTILLIGSSVVLIAYGLFGLAGSLARKTPSQKNSDRDNNQDEENWYFL